jgi:hypothetical protein
MIPLEKTLPPSHLKQSLEPQRQRGTDGVLQYFSCECGGVVDHWCQGRRKEVATVALARVKRLLCCVVW